MSRSEEITANQMAPVRRPRGLRDACLAIACLTAVVVAGAAKTEITVDPCRPAQTIRGFGASGCWWAQAVGTWEERPRHELLRLLFDPKAGIGLTIYRHNLGAGSFADETMPMPLRRTEPNWDASGRVAPNRDLAARRVLSDAVAAGAREVVLFAISPSLPLTRNGRAYGDLHDGKPASNLAPGQLGAYARELGAAVDYFLNERKLPVTVLSPLNEPEWDWSKPSQEGSFYMPMEAAAVLKACVDELSRRHLPVRIEGPESGNWKTALPYFEAIHQDAALRSRLTDFAVHSYFAESEQKKKLRAWLDEFHPNARLHMTEWCELRSGLEPGMESALTLARTVAEDFTLGRVSSWQFWLAASPHDYRDGLIHLDLDKHTFAPTKRLWALGQFSRYLPPGSVMLAANSSDARISTLAARRPDGSVAVVCVNPTDGEIAVACWMDGTAGWRLREGSCTDATRDLAPLAGTSNLVALAAQSVTTYVFEKAGTP